MREFTKEGRYELAVMATNALGSAAAYLNVTAQRIIDLLQITVLPTVVGRVVDINIMIRGGPDFVFDIDFGDGNETVLSLTRDGDLVMPQVGVSDGTHQYHLQYQYWDIGELQLIVNASNLVSYMVEKRMVIIDEAITQLVLTSDDGFLVSTNQPVVIKATVATGNNLVFDFDFGETHLLNVEK